MLNEQRIAAEAADRAAYANGRAAFASNAVKDFDLRRENGRQSVTASVKSGGVFYDVSLTLDEEGELVRCDCDCPAFYSRGHACAHIVAVLFAYCKRYAPDAAAPAAPPLETDLYASAMLARYSQSAAAEPIAPIAPLRLDPTLVLPEQTGSYSAAPSAPSLVLRSDTDIRDLSRLCQDLADGATVSFGGQRAVTLTPDAFEEHSRRLALLVMAKVAERAAFSNDKRALRLTPNAVDRLFAIYLGRTLRIQNGDELLYARCMEQNPALSVNAVCEKAQGFRFRSPQPVRCLSGERRLYLLCDSVLYACDEEYSNRLRLFWQALDGANNELTVSERDLPAFCSVVLPRLHGAVELFGDIADLRAFRPEPFVLELYLDLPSRDLVSAEPVCVYGERRVNLLQPPDSPEPRRDPVREKQLLRRLERWFTRRPNDGNRMYARGDEALYRLLTEGLQALNTDASLFVTNALRTLRVTPPPKVAAHVRFAGSVLEIVCDPGSFSREELAEALAAFRLRRKFYRLRSGQFLSLDSDTFRELMELTDGLGVDDAALAGPINASANRALFLEGQIQRDRALVFDRDEYFTRLAGRFAQPDAEPFRAPEGLRGELRPYQETGVRWLAAMERYGFGGILADDMGLGKTVQMISLFLLYAERVPDAARKPSLVVCPTSLVLNWDAELRRFAPGLRVLPVIGGAQSRADTIEALRDCDVAITSYDLLRRDISLYEELCFHYLVLDEAQYIKNFSTRNAQSVKKLKGESRFALTGTPIENRLSELWSIFDFLMPGYLYDYGRFKTLFEIPAMRDGDKEAVRRLNRMVSPFILRRLKREVLTELPPKVESVRTIPLGEEQRRLYTAATLAGRDELLAGNAGAIQILALLTRLRQICCDPALCCENYEGGSAKLDSCMELLREAAGSSHKVLLFSQFTSMLTRIEQRLQEEGIPCFLLRGSTPKEKRANMVESFNHDGTPIFLCSLKAGGTGLNLTGADVVVHYDPWWNQAAQDQATDRAHRIGQRSRVQVYKLIAQDTIEERIQALQQRKKELADAIIQEGDAALLHLTRDELLRLICG